MTAAVVAVLNATVVILSIAMVLVGGRIPPGTDNVRPLPVLSRQFLSKIFVRVSPIAVVLPAAGVALIVPPAEVREARLNNARVVPGIVVTATVIVTRVRLRLRSSVPVKQLPITPAKLYPVIFIAVVIMAIKSAVFL